MLITSADTCALKVLLGGSKLEALARDQRAKGKKDQGTYCPSSFLLGLAAPESPRPQLPSACRLQIALLGIKETAPSS